MQIGVETSRAVENKRIFVIDDDEISRAVLQFILHDENETHELTGLAEAVAKAAEGQPDLVVLGEGLARGNAAAAIGAVATHFPDAKILQVVASAADPLARTARQAGAHAVLAKPLTVEAVRERVDILLGRRAQTVVPLSVLTPMRP